MLVKMSLLDNTMPGCVAHDARAGLLGNRSQASAVLSSRSAARL